MLGFSLLYTGKDVRSQGGGIQVLVFAQLCHTGVEQMGIIDSVQQVFSLPAGLLQGKAQLLADAAGADGILGKQNRIVIGQGFAQTFRQREDAGQLVGVSGHFLLQQQIGGSDDFFTFGAIADEGDFRGRVSILSNRLPVQPRAARASFSLPRA